MILQPYIENAIRHGLRPKKEGGTIVISISKQMTDLHITIKDNGVGLSHGATKNKDHISLGIKLTNERLDLLNRLNNKQYQSKIYELNKEIDGTSGTCVDLVLNATAPLVPMDD